MKVPKGNIWLTIFFVILTLIATITVVSLQQTPSVQTTTNTVGTYTSTATYDYTAYVQPSTIYGNTTVLKPQDGPLYATLTDRIDLSLIYTFNSTLSTTPTITYSLNSTLKTTAWQYPLASTPPFLTDHTNIALKVPTFNKQEIEETKAIIDAETGITNPIYRSNTQAYYVIEITPNIEIEAPVKGQTIRQTFQPTLIVNVTHTDEGDVIIINNLLQTKSGSLTQRQTVTNQDAINQQYASYILIIASSIGLGYSAFTFKKQGVGNTQTKTANQLLEPYRHMIIEATENMDTVTTTIKVADIKELVKAAENLAKPILHIKNDREDSLYVIDGSTKYQYVPNVSAS